MALYLLLGRPTAILVLLWTLFACADPGNTPLSPPNRLVPQGDRAVGGAFCWRPSGSALFRPG